jgi:dTMP kinase
MGKLIVFEGIDGSGKSTQFRLMCDRFENEGVPFARLTFPQYQEPSSALIKMYLNGEFGNNPEDVNPYAASTFFAVDRYASYMKVWRDLYRGGSMILTDRYTTSNALHQGAKLPKDKRIGFFKWLYDFEFGLMELPKPDIVIYMDIPAREAAERLKERQVRTGTTADIHERDLDYLNECARCGEEAADYYGWRKVGCFNGPAPKSERELHEEIYEILTKTE